jgi:hypothetical protein
LITDDERARPARARTIEPEVCGGDDLDFIAIPRLFTGGAGYLVLAQLGPDIVALRSVDGEQWTCVGDGPIFAATEIEGSDRVHTLAAAQTGDEINVLIEALMTREGGEVVSELWLGEVTGL